LEILLSFFSSQELSAPTTSFYTFLSVISGISDLICLIDEIIRKLDLKAVQNQANTWLPTLEGKFLGIDGVSKSSKRTKLPQKQTKANIWFETKENPRI
jgi:hypothetical protein